MSIIRPDDSGSHELEQRILAVLSEVVGVGLKAGERDLVGRLDAVEQQLTKAETSVVVLGQFSSGKSSLLNALLEEREELFPTDPYLSTRVLTSAQWGPEEVITLALAARDGTPAEERPVGREALRSYISEAELQDGEAAAEAERVTSVSIVTPNPKLRGGLVVIDTPGIGGVAYGHTQAALGVLTQGDADLVLYVIDATRRPLPSEILFIERVAKAVEAGLNPERLLLVLTKADQEGDWNAAVRDAQGRLAAIPGIEDKNVIIPVSSDLRARQLAGEQPLDDTLAGFSRFEAQLSASVTSARLRRRVGSALAELDLAVQGLLDPVREALAVLDAKDAAARGELEAAAGTRQAEAEDLAAGAATWPADLRVVMAGVATSLREQATADLATLWRDVRAGYRQKNSPWLDDSQLLIDELAGRLSLLVGELRQAAAEQTVLACDEIAARSGLRVRSPILGGLSSPPLPESGMAGSWLDRPVAAANLREALNAARAGAEAGAKVGGFVGDIAWAQAMRAALANSGAPAEQVAPRDQVVQIGGVVGSMVGAVLAFVDKIRAINKLARSERVAALDQLFAPWEAEQRDTLHASVQSIVDAATAQAEAELRSRIARRQGESEAAAREIAAAVQAVGRDNAATVAELSARRETLEDIGRRLDGLAGELRARLGQEKS